MEILENHCHITLAPKDQTADVIGIQKKIATGTHLSIRLTLVTPKFCNTSKPNGHGSK